MEHVRYMADIGCGYTKSKIQYMAADLSRSIGKQVKEEKRLSDQWFYVFLKLWPDLMMAQNNKRFKSAEQKVRPRR